MDPCIHGSLQKFSQHLPDIVAEVEDRCKECTQVQIEEDGYEKGRVPVKEGEVDEGILGLGADRYPLGDTLHEPQQEDGEPVHSSNQDAAIKDMRFLSR